MLLSGLNLSSSSSAFVSIMTRHLLGFGGLLGTLQQRSGIRLSFEVLQDAASVTWTSEVLQHEFMIEVIHEKAQKYRGNPCWCSKHLHV